MTFSVLSSHIVYLGKIGLLAASYFATAKLGLELYSVNTFAALVWPPTGIALASLLLFGYRLFPGIALGAFLINLSLGAPPFVAIGVALGNTLEALIAVYLLHRFGGLLHPFEKLQESVRFIIFAGLLAPLIGASIGVGSLFLGGILPVGEIFETWITWWIGDVLGAVIIAPFLISWLGSPRVSFSLERMVEFCLLFFSIVIANLLVFWVPAVPGKSFLLLYLVSFPLIWTVIRFGPRTTSLALLTTATIAILSTLQGRGPFARIPLSEGLLFLQIFIGTLAAVFLPFMAAIKERTRIVEALEEHVEKLEHALKKIRSADQAKNDFLAILAHELRNPLSPVLSALELVKTRGLNAPDSAQLLEVVERQIHTIADLLDDLLDISRISKKQFKLEKETIDVRKVIARSAQAVDYLVKAKGHTLVIASPEEPLWLEADPLRLEQIIVNILNNAAKYTEPGGSISLSAAQEEGEVVLRVEDNGIGISHESLTLIFEPFMQATQGKQRMRGLGIGLSISKKLAELHGGGIEAKSEGPGKGSVFIIRFPSSPNLPLPIAPEASPQGETSSLFEEQGTSNAVRVLVVDDNEAAAEGLATLLRHHGHDARCVYGGREAITLAHQFRPDAIVLDIGMPGMDGYEVARHLRNHFPSTMTLIALTGFGQEEDKARAREAGFDHHLTKPVSIRDVERVLPKKDDFAALRSPEASVSPAR